MRGRTHRPELRPELCGTCRICQDGCPARVFRDLAAESDTMRGRLAKGDEIRSLQEQPPCRLACPIAQDIPGYLNRIAEGDADGALEWVLQHNPFPAVLGQVCHHPCERACISGSLQRPPAIRAIKRFASMAARPEIKVPDRFKGKVAIAGAGPAGLAAAWALRREGVRPVVYESLPVPGGLLVSAIPPFRLPRKSIREDVEYILRHGVELRLDAHLAAEELRTLLSEYDAVILACGAPRAKQSDILGSRLPGVWLGLDFLRRLAFGRAPEIIGPVVVIGGGNVATDAARWAVRTAAPVTVIYRRDREDMPAYPEEVEACAREGIEFLFRSQPVAFEGEPRSGIRQIRVQATTPGDPGKDGRRSFIPVGNRRTIPVRTVILALGQEQNLDKWTGGLGIGALADRIYAAGDMITGPATVVEAVAGGIQCARRILREVFA